MAAGEGYQWIINFGLIKKEKSSMDIQYFLFCVSLNAMRLSKLQQKATRRIMWCRKLQVEIIKMGGATLM